MSLSRNYRIGEVQNIKRWMKNSTRRAVYHANRIYGEKRPRSLEAALDEENYVRPWNSHEHIDGIYARNSSRVKRLADEYEGTCLGSALESMSRAYSAWWESQFVHRVRTPHYSTWIGNPI